MHRLLIGVVTLACSLGCSGARSDPGLDLQLRVRGAQLVRRALPAPAGGPLVTFVDVRAPRVVPGEGGTLVSGRTVRGAFAVNIGSDREDSYWIVPTGVEDSAVPGELSWQALLDFSPSLKPGSFELRVQATDGTGKPGEVSRAPYQALPLYPDGDLVVSLEWDANVDADLLVRDPSGVTLGGKNLNTWSAPPPGEPQAPPDAYKTGGILDQDSNANCLIDGRRKENAVWQSAAPKGRYVVLVALVRGCGLNSTSYRVTVRRQGKIISTVGGDLSASDALAYPQEPLKSPGVWATEFDVP